MMDIGGFDIDESAYNAALAVGLIWYAMRQVDNHLDLQTLTESESREFLHQVRSAWSTKDTRASNEIIAATTSLLHSGYIGNPYAYEEILEELYDAVLQHLFPIDWPDRQY